MSCVVSLGFFPICTPCSPCYSRHRWNPWPWNRQHLKVERSLSVRIRFPITASYRITHRRPQWPTFVGRFLNQFCVAHTLDQGAIGAGSIQQRVHSHSDVFHQVELSVVRPPRRPDGLHKHKSRHLSKVGRTCTRLHSCNHTHIVYCGRWTSF